jgi:transposase-like protein
MTTHESAFSELAARLAGTDPTLTTSLRDILAAALQELIEAELTAAIGAAPGERTPERVAQRNRHRSKLLSTPTGDIEVAIPKLRAGSFFPELLEPRRRVDRALWAVIMTEDITGSSTRKVHRRRRDLPEQGIGHPERRYIAAASIAELTPDTTELALPAAPRT